MLEFGDIVTLSFAKEFIGVVLREITLLHAPRTLLVFWQPGELKVAYYEHDLVLITKHVKF